MDYIEICEWDKFQHYKKRNPPWIKLYVKMLDDDEFDCLPDDSNLLFFCLLPFASRWNNKIKLNFRWLQKKLPINKPITSDTLQPLIDAGFIQCYQGDSGVIAERNQDATPETETETKPKTEGEKETKQQIVNSNPQFLELLKTQRNFYFKEINKIWVLNKNEAVTFARVVKHLEAECIAGRQEIGIFKDAIEWAKQARYSTAKNKKGLYIKKIKTETGFEGQGKII